jgi:hypothetical protein
LRPQYAAVTAAPVSVVLPVASLLIDRSAGYVTNTVDVPASEMAEPELLDDRIVVRASVGPVEE